MKRFEFPVTVYGNLEKYNDVLSKARCRIFYKYGNRNGTYITDEFAEKLLSTIAYVPVKGIYDDDDEDYDDHGEKRSEGRIYGIVPENYNFAWEKHLDEDGIEREYACVDVLLFTALYEEAEDIVGKAQSMELYEPTLKYHRAIIKGLQYIVFEEGCFLGLQVLGDDVEPCFEGAAFFSLKENIEKVINKIQQIESTYSKKGGSEEMPKLNFKLSDNQKYDALWTLLNTEYNEEGNWAISYTICDIYDEYALAYNYESGEYERIYYTKNDETDSVEISAKKKCYVMDISEEEKQTVDTLRKLNGDTYELVSDTLTNAQENLEKNSEFSSKIEELNNTVSTLNTEKATAETNYADAQAKVETLTAEVEGLKEYKVSIETEQKENILSEYTECLDEETLNTYREKMSDYTVTDLDKELAYELKKTNISAFSKNPASGLLPKDTPKGGIDEILAKYVK